jgi:hypothetical protein
MLQFHQPLNPQKFTPQLMSRIEKSAKLRQKIIWLFTILAVVLSGFLLSFLAIENSITALFYQQSIYLISLVAFSFIANCCWLLTEEN